MVSLMGDVLRSPTNTVARAPLTCTHEPDSIQGPIVHICNASHHTIPAAAATCSGQQTAAAVCSSQASMYHV